MTAKLFKINLAAAAALVLFSAPLPAFADSTNATPVPPKHRIVPVPFKGKLKAVDKKNQAISFVDASNVTIIIYITPDTKITKDDKKATLEDATVEELCGGQYAIADDGRRLARTIHFGARKPKSLPPPPTQPLHAAN